MKTINPAEPVESAFRYLMLCRCRQGPALWNDGGQVFFMCDCGRVGPKVQQGVSAAIRACSEWNRMSEQDNA